MLLRSRLAGTSFAFLPTGVARLFCVLIFLATVPCILAGSWTWVGTGGNVFWNTAANWTGSAGAPTSNAATDIIFSGTTNTGTSGTPLNQSGGTFQLNNITFGGSAGSFFLGG